MFLHISGIILLFLQLLYHYQSFILLSSALIFLSGECFDALKKNSHVSADLLMGISNLASKCPAISQPPF